MSSSRSRRKILHIAPTPFFADRGCHIRIEGIVRALDEIGYQNRVVTYHHGRDVKTVETSRIKPIKNYTKTEAGPSKYKLWADWRLLWLTVKEIRRYQPDAIHAHLHEGLMIGLVAKTLLFWKRIPLLADLQGSLTGELEAHGSFAKHAWLKLPVKLIERTLLWFAKTVVCSSEHSLNIVRNEFGFDEDKSSLVQDGADLRSPLPEIIIQKASERYQIPLDKPIIVYSGALLPGKGLSELKELILITCERSSDPHFLIVGYPTDQIEPFIAQHKLQHRVTLTGRVPFERLPHLLGLAKIAVDPKSNDSGEGSGKMLNYISGGLPVLAFSTENNEDFLPPGSQLAYSVDDMSNLLLEWLKDPFELETIRDANLKHFIRYYSWARTSEQLREVYSKLI